MYYLLTYHRPTNPSDRRQQAIRRVGLTKSCQAKATAERFKKALEENGYIVANMTKVLEGGK